MTTTALRLGRLDLSIDGQLSLSTPIDATSEDGPFGLFVKDLGPIANLSRWSVPASERRHFDTLAALWEEMPRYA